MALIHNPELLILDEPTVGVDPELRARIWRYLREIAAGGTTIVITTHYVRSESRVCFKLISVDRGGRGFESCRFDAQGTLCLPYPRYFKHVHTCMHLRTQLPAEVHLGQAASGGLTRCPDGELPLRHPRRGLPRVVQAVRAHSRHTDQALTAS